MMILTYEYCRVFRKWCLIKLSGFESLHLRLFVWWVTNLLELPPMKLWQHLWMIPVKWRWNLFLLQRSPSPTQQKKQHLKNWHFPLHLQFELLYQSKESNSCSSGWQNLSFSRKTEKFHKKCIYMILMVDNLLWNKRN